MGRGQLGRPGSDVAAILIYHRVLVAVQAELAADRERGLTRTAMMVCPFDDRGRDPEHLLHQLNWRGLMLGNERIEFAFQLGGGLELGEEPVAMSRAGLHW